jgi:hypothetical protein
MNRRIETRRAAQRVIDDGDMLLFRQVDLQRQLN